MSAESTTGSRIEIDLAATPHRVYEAIATPAGVRAWWTDGSLGDAVGQVGRLTFGSGWTELRIDRLVSDEEIEWTCVGQDIAHFTPTDEWVGTTIRFRLAPLGAGERTHLEFVHEGLVGLGCAEMCVKGWDHYIGTSLRALVETGTGSPGPGAGSGAD